MKLFAVLSTLIVHAYMQEIITIDESLPYEKEILYSGNLLYTRNLIVDYSTNNLYFSYKNDQMGDSFAAILNLDTRELTYIEGVSGKIITALTVDQRTHDVYIGGDDGIYKHSNGTNYVERIANVIGGIGHMCFKDRLYYVNLLTDYVYILLNGEPARTHRFFPKATFFLMDNDSVMYSINGFFFKRVNGTNEVFYNGALFIHAINMDKNGKVFACTGDGEIYEIMRDKKATFRKVASLDTICLGIAFDNDNNFILSEYEKDEGERIVRLKPVTETNKTTTVDCQCSTENNQEIEVIENKINKMFNDFNIQLTRMESTLFKILTTAENLNSTARVLNQRTMALEAMMSLKTDQKNKGNNTCG